MTWGYRIPDQIQVIISTIENDLNFDENEQTIIIHALKMTYREWVYDTDIHPTASSQAK